MSEHYFTPDPRSPSRPREFTAILRGMEFRFVADRGVFSHDRVDFGTRLLAESMDIAPDDVVLDLGCGYGVLGIVAARLAHRGQVYLVDINERAVDLARRNIELNGLANARALSGDGTAPVRGVRFTKVVMNPPFRAGKATVHRLIAEAQAVLVPGGSLWVVVGNKQGAPSLKRHLMEHFAQFWDVARQGGFHVYAGVRG